MRVDDIIILSIDDHLIDQGFVKKNSEVSVKEHAASVAKQLGDEITVRRFVRFQVGELQG